MKQYYYILKYPSPGGAYYETVCISLKEALEIMTDLRRDGVWPFSLNVTTVKPFLFDSIVDELSPATRIVYS